MHALMRQCADTTSGNSQMGVISSRADKRLPERTRQPAFSCYEEPTAYDNCSQTANSPHSIEDGHLAVVAGRQTYIDPQANEASLPIPLVD